MAIRNIVKDGDPILKKVCRPVTAFDSRLAEILDDMKETLLQANGLGLAAPQVGIMRRYCIVMLLPTDENGETLEEEEGAEPNIIELINPEILSSEGEVVIYEGCLSYPGRNGLIARPLTITFKAQDRTGKEYTMTVNGINARCVCHETNHLDGITITDLAEEWFEDEDEE